MELSIPYRSATSYHKMASRRVRTEGPRHDLSGERSTLEQAALISDLEESISVNRHLLHSLLNEHLASARDGLPTASRIPHSLAEAMIKENCRMERRLESLSSHCEELVNSSASTLGEIKEFMRSEASSVAQIKADEYTALKQELTLKDKTVERLKEEVARKEGILSLQRPTPKTQELLRLLEDKAVHIKEFKSKLSLKLKYSEHRRNQIYSAYLELQRGSLVQREQNDTSAEPIADLGYGK